MNKFTSIIFIVISIILIIGAFHDEYGNILGKILLFWALFIAIYPRLVKKKILDKE